MKTLEEFVRSTPFYVIAHRGASGLAPENTLAAIKLAVEGGAKMIEMDVQTTSDAQVVVFHDHVLGRTTNGHGKVRNTPFSQLQQLDAGEWFDKKFANERVPLLRDALDVIAGRAYLNLEVKPLGEDPHAEQTMRTVLELITKHNHLPFSVFSSFDHHALKLIKSINNKAHTAALQVPGDNRLPSEILRDCSADGYGCSVHELTKKRSANLARHRIPWGVYTVNDEDHLHKALQYGAQAVVSNFPGNIQALYESTREL